jgi:ABC-type multidrug transport system fused ATPase/permease subunit
MYSSLGNLSVGSSFPISAAQAQYPSYGEHVIQISFGLIFTFFVSLTCFRSVRSHLREKRRTARRIARIERQRRQIIGEDDGHESSRRAHLLSEDQDDVEEESLNADTPRARSVSESRILEDEKPEPLSSLRDKRDTMIELTFEKLGLELRSNGAKVLNGVSGSCRPGRVTAIMGPSGASSVLYKLLNSKKHHLHRFESVLV